MFNLSENKLLKPNNSEEIIEKSYTYKSASHISWLALKKYQMSKEAGTLAILGLAPIVI